MKLLLVYNPNAGGGRAAKILPDVRESFSCSGVTTEVLVTQYAWHGIELVRRVDFSQYDGVIACGGDGTLFEVVNGYYQNRGCNKPPIGLLPIGTGNAFIKEMGLKNQQWVEAIGVILSRRLKKIDVARLKTEGEEFYFLNMLGIGLPVDIGKTSIGMKGLGEISYLLGTLYHTAFLETFGASVEIDGRLIDRELVFAEIANTRYTGSKFIMAPGAIVDDGYLDVILANKVSRARVLKLLPAIFKGKHVEDPAVEVLRAKKIKISTTSTKSLLPDGELFGRTPIEVECLHRDISFFWK